MLESGGRRHLHGHGSYVALTPVPGDRQTPSSDLQTHAGKPSMYIEMKWGVYVQINSSHHTTVGILRVKTGSEKAQQASLISHSPICEKKRQVVKKSRERWHTSVAHWDENE